MALKVSVCVTTYNESKDTIQKLLEALDKQALKADEIIVADATIITNYQASIIKQFKNSKLKFINKANISRSAGRNLAIRKARNEIIAITDAGCVPQREWLENLVKPFDPSSQGYDEAGVVVGSYKMIARNNFEKAEAVFLGIKKQDIKSDFLPSARSMAFTKTIWKKAGGFPEDLNDTAEDTVFNINLIKAGAKFIVVKKAVVDWQMPETIKNFYLKIKNYARGDAQSGIWWHPTKKWRTHNIKVLSVILRYLILIFAYFFNQPFFWLLAICYLLFAIFKAGPWGIPLQFVSDFGCIIGFNHGIFKRYCYRNKLESRV